MEDTLTAPDVKSAKSTASQGQPGGVDPAASATAEGTNRYQDILSRLKGDEPVRGDAKVDKNRTVTPPQGKPVGDQLDPNAGTEEHPTPHDKKFFASINRRAQLGGAVGGRDDNEAKEAKRSLDEDIRRQASIREQWKLAEKEVSKKYDPDVYNLWRPIGWFNHDETDKKDGSYVVNHPAGGKVQISSQALNYHDSAIKDVKAIEAGVLHAKHNWKENGIVVGGGDENFKAATWAYAQVHGLKVLNYKPEGEHLAYAQALIQQKQQEMQQAQRTQQPQQPFVDPAAQTANVSPGSTVRQDATPAAPANQEGDGTNAKKGAPKDAAKDKGAGDGVQQEGAARMPDLDTYRAMQEKDALQRRQLLQWFPPNADGQGATQQSGGFARQSLRLLPAATQTEASAVRGLLPAPETATEVVTGHKRTARAGKGDGISANGEERSRVFMADQSGFTAVIDTSGKVPLQGSTIIVDPKGYAAVVKPVDMSQGANGVARKESIVIDNETGKIISDTAENGGMGGKKPGQGQALLGTQRRALPAPGAASI